MNRLAVCFIFGAVSLIPLLAEAASVRDFGAKGDGKTDDTAAIQKAVHEANDGVLEFPKGNYLLTKTIEVKLAERGVTSFTGLGGVGRVTMSGAGPAFRFTGTHMGSADPASFKPGVWEKERMPQVDGLEIVGTHAEADGIEFVKVMQPTVRATLIRNVRDGIRLYERNRNVLIDSCHIYNNTGVGVFFDRVNVHQAIIHGSHISYCKSGGIKIAASEIRNFHFTGNDIEYNYDLKAEASADILIDVTEGSVREGTIASNTIQAKPSPGGANIRFIGNAESADKVGVISITGNMISSQKVNVHLVRARGIVLSGNTTFVGHEHALLLEECRNISVGTQVIDHNPDYRGDVTGGITLKKCKAITLSGIQMEDIRAGSLEEGGAIEVIDSDGVKITSSQIYEPGHRGIFVQGSHNVSISDCIIADRREEPTLTQSVMVAGRSKGVLVRGNILMRGKTGDISAETFSAKAEGNSPYVK
ncbi:MAG TPA: right-handed parallel beta-helix repeat-containing protein [Verrucomicrobiae bacterium]